jgi:hypothetical protein
VVHSPLYTFQARHQGQTPPALEVPHKPLTIPERTYPDSLAPVSRYDLRKEIRWRRFGCRWIAWASNLGVFWAWLIEFRGGGKVLMMLAHHRHSICYMLLAPSQRWEPQCPRRPGIAYADIAIGNSSECDTSKCLLKCNIPGLWLIPFEFSTCCIT